MSSWYRLILNPEGAFAGDFDSIKIYGSIINGYSELYGSASEILKVIKNGELRVSSPMPTKEGKFYVFKPMLPTEKLEYKDFKIFKKKKFVDERLAMESLKEGKYSKESVEEIIGDDTAGIKTVELPGVSIGRYGGSSTIYYKMASLYTHKAWILVKMSDEIKDRVLAVFRYLGDVGISKKRSTGFGHFKLSLEDYELENDGMYSVILSKYIPRQEELGAFPFERSRYEVKLIAGYTKDGKAIPKMRALVEGSVIPADYSPVGRIVDVHPKYSVVGVPVVI